MLYIQNKNEMKNNKNVAMPQCAAKNIAKYSVQILNRDL